MHLHATHQTPDTCSTEALASDHSMPCARTGGPHASLHGSTHCGGCRGWRGGTVPGNGLSTRGRLGLGLGGTLLLGPLHAKPRRAMLPCMLGGSRFPLRVCGATGVVPLPPS